jgi:transcriptional regulator with XRE-family HTH domain
MKIFGNESNEIISKEIGQRIKSRRIEISMTQEELSLESGVSLRTIVNIENGKNVAFQNIISVLRAIKLSENLDLLVPKHVPNPFDLIELGHPRERASKKGLKKSPSWSWGDEK